MRAARHSLLDRRDARDGAIGGAICAELATLPNFTYPGDIFPSSYFYNNDLGKPEIVLSGRGEVATLASPAFRRRPIPTCSRAGPWRTRRFRA